ncbi:S1 family peptidase [Streptomyces sp. NPDC004596]
MVTQIDATVLYSAVRLTVQFSEYGSIRPTLYTGTGFVVRDGRGHDAARYLVTNRHVVDPNWDERRRWELATVRIAGYFQDPRDPRSSPLWQEGVLTEPEVHVASTWHVDLAVLPLNAANRLEVVSGSGHFNSLPAEMLALEGDFLSGDITVGRQVLMPGYPGVDDQAAQRPILVGGVIASDPRFPAVLGTKDYPDEVFCHAFSWQGMSGSPVLSMVPRPATWADLESGGLSVRTVLAGVNAGHFDVRSDSTAGAISRFVRGDALADLLRQAGAHIFEVPVE